MAYVSPPKVTGPAVAVSCVVPGATAITSAVLLAVADTVATPASTVAQTIAALSTRKPEESLGVAL